MRQLGWKWAAMSRDNGATEGLNAHIEMSSPIQYISGITASEKAEAAPAVVRGIVTVEAVSAVEICAIRIRLMGVLSMGDSTEAPKAKGDKSINFLEETEDLFEGSGTVVEPGEQYQFPFEFVLDANSPESIQTSLASVSYCTKLLVTCQDGSANRTESSPIELEADVKELQLLRTVQQNSSLASDSLLVDGVWRGFLRYSFVTDSKVLKINERFNATLKMDQLFACTHQVDSIKVYLVQQVSLACPDGEKDVGQTQKMILDNHQCQPEDFDDNGNLVKDWSFKIHDVYKRKQKSQHVYPFTNHVPTVEGAPTLKISHHLRLCICLQEAPRQDFFNQLMTTQSSATARASKTPLSLDFFGSRTASCDVSNQATNNSQKSRKRIELTINCPVYLMHAKSANEIPPRYEEVGSPLAEVYDSSDDVQMESPQMDYTYESSSRKKSLRPSNGSMPENAWFQLVGKWNSEYPPAYSEVVPGVQ